MFTNATKSVELRKGWTLLCTIVIGCCAAMMASDAPDALVSSALGLFPGYHLLRMQERNAGLRTFLRENSPKANPSLVRADFDGDGNSDLALLLRDDKSPATKLVVLLCSKEQKCQIVYEKDETALGDIVYLLRAKSGVGASESEATDAQEPSVKLQSPGIQVAYFEKAAVVLFWNKKLKKIEEVETED